MNLVFSTWLHTFTHSRSLFFLCRAVTFFLSRCIKTFLLAYVQVLAFCSIHWAQCPCPLWTSVHTWFVGTGPLWTHLTDVGTLRRELHVKGVGAWSGKQPSSVRSDTNHWHRPCPKSPSTTSFYAHKYKHNMCPKNTTTQPELHGRCPKSQDTLPMSKYM